MNRSSVIATAIFASLSLAPIGTHIVAPVSADEPALYGYSAESSRSERQWEEKLRAIPSPDNLRAYMQRLSARPHNVGSPYDKDNAEWIASKFKEFGLDAQIETFDVLYPTPKERAMAGPSSRPNCRSLPSRSIQLPISKRNNSPPTTPTRSTATLPRRSFM
jgi:hypothetical protein